LERRHDHRDLEGCGVSINELVAIECMGWAINIEMFPGQCEYAYWVDAETNSPTLCYDHISQSMWRDPQFEPFAAHKWNPAYSVDDAITALWRICPEGAISMGRNPSLLEHFTVAAYNAKGDCVGQSCLKSKPLAICKAALMAAGVAADAIETALKEAGA